MTLDDLALVDGEVELADHAQAAEALAHLAQLQQGVIAISTRALPSRPCGRAAISTTSIAPSSRKRVVAGSTASRFSQTKAAR